MIVAVDADHHSNCWRLKNFQSQLNLYPCQETVVYYHHDVFDISFLQLRGLLVCRRRDDPFFLQQIEVEIISVFKPNKVHIIVIANTKGNWYLAPPVREFGNRLSLSIHLQLYFLTISVFGSIG